MNRICFRPNLFIVPAVLLVASYGATNAMAQNPSSSGPTILRYDFNDAASWPDLSVEPKSAAAARASREAVGTIDVAKSARRSGGLRLSIGGSSTETVGLVSGLLPVRCTETNLGKLTLSFDHSVSSAQPITVRVESFSADRRRTGGLETRIYPAALDFYQRAALELSSMKPVGAGTFRATDPFIRLTFGVGSGELCIDNVSYSSPAYYVSTTGSDKNDGRTEKTAFADPQKAVELAQPGDIILLMDGAYKRAPTTPAGDGIIGWRRGGAPAAWVVFKNYPGQHPILASEDWNAIKIGRGSSEAKSVAPALSYIEVRGLHIRGNALEAKDKYPEDMNESRGTTNGNGINVDGRGETNKPHHLRFADNLVEFCPGGGISSINSDWVTYENNEIRNNCWWNIYGCSGISFLGGEGNFDAEVGNYKVVIRNNRLFGNEGLLPWKAVKKMSDGNGIIIDSIQGFQGRILIQSNLTVNNGGSGIHVFRGQRIDIINNTAYLNGAAPLLRWGQIFVQATDDARIINNILVSRPDQPINTVGMGGDDKNNKNILRANNLYFGGASAPVPGESDRIADPLFVRPSKDYRIADFRLKPGSPALLTGRREIFSPLLDIQGNPRAAIPTAGAFEKPDVRLSGK